MLINIMIKHKKNVKMPQNTFTVNKTRELASLPCYKKTGLA